LYRGLGMYDDDIEGLRELVNDERARRVFAEQQLAAERRRREALQSRAKGRSKTPRWKKTRRRVLSRLLGGSHRGQEPSPIGQQTPDPPVPSSPSSLPPYQPTMRMAAWNAPEWLHRAAECVDLAQDRESLAGSDMVFVAGGGALTVLNDWLTWPARQPLVIWDWGHAEVEKWAEHLSQRDLVVGPKQLGVAKRLDPWPVVDPREVRPGLVDVGEPGTPIATAGTPLREIVVRALLREPMKWSETEMVPELDGLVVTASGDREKAGVLSRLLAAERHNPGAAIERIAGQVGIKLPRLLPLVGILLVSRWPNRLRTALEQISRLRYRPFEVVVGLHGAGALHEVRAQVTALGLEGKVRILGFEDRLTLGECLNQAAEQTGATILAKFDDDDRYGRWYLDEAVDELTATGADLVGKATQYVHLSQTDQLILFQPGKEYSELGYVNGPTFVMPRHTWEQVQFPHRRSRVDSVFVRGLKATGGTIRSSSRYEFILGRHGEGHTWMASDERFLASGEVAGRGSDDSQVWLGDR
jgi:hypothetical protein